MKKSLLLVGLVAAGLLVGTASLAMGNLNIINKTGDKILMTCDTFSLKSVNDEQYSWQEVVDKILHGKSQGSCAFSSVSSVNLASFNISVGEHNVLGKVDSVLVRDNHYDLSASPEGVNSPYVKVTLSKK